MLAEKSCDAYRAVVHRDPAFVSYFRHATPEEELGNLNIGSRPSRRRPAAGGVETLRAIPWIFAWCGPARLRRGACAGVIATASNSMSLDRRTQNRLILPAWLGFSAALRQAFAEGHKEELQQMYREWPFFKSTVDLVEMVLAKADMRICKLYEDVLVHDPSERALVRGLQAHMTGAHHQPALTGSDPSPPAPFPQGDKLRRDYTEAVSCILQVTGHGCLLDNNRTLRKLIQTRAPYIDPINILQVEILRRLRTDPENQRLRDALLISINGIAAGMRNTG